MDITLRGFLVLFDRDFKLFNSVPINNRFIVAEMSSFLL